MRSQSHIVLKCRVRERKEGIPQHGKRQARHCPGLGRVEQNGAHASSKHHALLLVRHHACTCASPVLELVESPGGRRDVLVGSRGLVEFLVCPCLVDKVDAVRWSLSLSCGVMCNTFLVSSMMQFRGGGSSYVYVIF